MSEATYKFKTKPMEHQFRALKFLADNDGVGALLMDPGTGKTKVIIDYTGAYTAKYEELKVLVAAPLSALDTWVEEYEKHLGFLRNDNGLEEIPAELHVLTDGTIEEKAEYVKTLPEFKGLQIVVVNHDAFKYRHPAHGADGRELKTVTVKDRIISAVTEHWCPDLVVVDEMHRLKTHTSNTSKSFAKIGQYSFMRIGATGTVAPHSPLDFYGQWRFLNPQRFHPKWQIFKQQYAVWGGFEGREVLGYINLPEMKKKVRKDAFIAKKRDCLELPPVTDIVVPVRLDSELSYYKEMADELIVQLPSGKQSISRNVLTKMLRLRQITGGSLGYRDLAVDEDGKPVLDQHGVQKEVSRTEDIGDSKLKRLWSKVSTIVDAGEKQVIFAHFRRDVARIEEHCRKKLKAEGYKDVPVYVINGDVKNRTRTKRRKAFYHHKGPAIFVAQMRTVSLAVNEFVVASYGHFYSYSQLRDDYEQARDRIDRKGQEVPVTFYHYVVPGSIDQAILESHKEKERLETTVTKRAKQILTLENWNE